MSEVSAQEVNSTALEASANAAVDLASSAKTCLRILVVDDDLSLLEVSKQILLLENGFVVETATSVTEALKKIEKHPYDAIVSDYEMPQKNGLEFLKELRQLKNETPFIMFTGRGREEVAIAALNLGADRYISKNGSPETVFAELSDALRKTLENKRSKNLLVESETKYRTLVEESLQGIAIAQGVPPQIFFSNPSFGKMLGYSREELTSLSPKEVMDLVYSTDRKVFFERFYGRLMGQYRESSYNFRAVRKDGSVLWLQATSNYVQYNGKPAVQGVFLRIDEQKKAEEALRKSEERYRNFANSLPDIVFECDGNGKLTFFNRSAFEITGYTPEELEKGLNVLQFLVVEDRERAKENMQNVMTGQMLGVIEYRLLKKSGDVSPILVRTATVVLENGSVGLRGLVLDITDRKRAEQELLQHKNNAELYLNIVGNIILALDSAGKITMLNKKAYEILGYGQGELEGKDWAETCLPKEIHGELGTLFEAWAHGKVETPEHYENYIVTKNGEKRLISWYNTALRNRDGRITGTLSSGEDITDRRKAKEQLENDKNYYEVLLDSILSGIIVVDSETRQIVDANPAALRFIGTNKKEDVVGKICHKFICPNETGKCPIMDLGQTVDKAERVLLTSKGELLPVIKSVVKVKHNGRILLVENYVDISAQKKIEANLKENQSHLELMNEKLRVVGGLTRHDVRNKLCGVTGNAYVIKKKFGDKAEINGYIENMEQSCKEIERLFDFAKTYEQLGLEALTYIDVDKAISDTMTLFSTKITPQIASNCTGLTVLADSFLIQLFYNLIGNSMKHGKKVTSIRVCFEKTNDSLNLIYTDDGVGIPNENKSRLFSVGFSTGGSTGYGLYLIKKMVDVYGWAIQENGEPGKGAKFTIYIPQKNFEGTPCFQISS
jgi:PAS domain S-box-containing protein